MKNENLEPWVGGESSAQGVGPQQRRRLVGTEPELPGKESSGSCW